MQLYLQWPNEQEKSFGKFFFFLFYLDLLGFV